MKIKKKTYYSIAFNKQEARLFHEILNRVSNDPGYLPIFRDFAEQIIVKSKSTSLYEKFEQDIFGYV